MRHYPQMMAHMDAVIERIGYAVQAVFAGPDTPEFAYTVGLTAKGLPELIVVGMPLQAALTTLNGLARELLDGDPLKVGEPLTHVFENFDCMLIEAARSEADRFMIATFDRYPDYRALQLIWQDDMHRWPWDEAYDKKFIQPVLKPVLH